MDIAACQELYQKVPAVLRRLRLSHSGQPNEIDERQEKVRGYGCRDTRTGNKERKPCVVGLSSGKFGRHAEAPNFKNLSCMDE
jgi:hypothetical protein